MKSFLRIWALLMFLASLTLSCGGEDGTSDTDGDTDSDTDADADADGDTDTDADGDCTVPAASECGGGWGVFDSGSCMCWEVPGSTAEYTWDGAVAYCENLTLGGFSDWVLASRQDYIDMLGGCDERVLLGAAGLCNACDSIDSCPGIFAPPVEGDLYWILTVSSSDANSPYYIEPFSGYLSTGSKPNLSMSRCVRLAQ